MHPGAHHFVRLNLPLTAQTVVEVGSRNINGTVRTLHPKADWWGIDVMDGTDVDEVADGATWQPPEPVDLAICCEVFEHTSEWREIVANMVSWLRPGGTILITCAGPGRPEHSAITGGLGLQPGEWYENIDPGPMTALLSSLNVDANVKVTRDDLYVVGTLRE
jgi:hypothetical protein